MSTSRRSPSLRSHAAALACALSAVGAAFLPLQLAIGTIALLVVVGWCGAARWLDRALLPLLMVQAAVLCLVRLAGLWPCDIGCQGGGYYQHLGAVPVTALALAVYALLAALAIRDALRAAWSPALARLTYGAAGASLFFLWVAVSLGMDCSFCRAVHLTILLAISCLIPPRTGLGWRAAGVWLCAGFLALNLAFHHQVVADAQPPSAGGPAAGTPDSSPATLRAGRAYRAMDSGRRSGTAGARYRVVLVVDPHCPVCAEEHGPLHAALAALATGSGAQLAIETLFLTRASDQSGADLARHLLAAAGAGQARFDAVLAVVLGAPAEVGFPGMRMRIAEVDDSELIDAAMTREHAAIDQLLDDDAARLRTWYGGAISLVTPQVLLVDEQAPAPGRLLKHWTGRMDAAAVTSAIAAEIGR